MKRVTFLRLLALAVAPSVLRPHIQGQPENLTNLLGAVMWPTLRYDIPHAEAIKLPQTGDAQKRLLRVTGRSGCRVDKVIIVSGLLKVTGDQREEMAYLLVKKAKDAARNIAHYEGIDWRHNERTWPA